MDSKNDMRILKEESLEVQTRVEIDSTISTAKAYPRNVKEAIAEIEAIATQNREVAESCFYSLPRGEKIISGESIRLAEIVASCWGNLNVGYRIVANNGKTITAQAVCHDLQKNLRVTAEVEMKITDKKGKLFSEDMQIMKGSAAGAAAFRNVIFKAVPKAFLGGLLTKIKQKAAGTPQEIEQRRKNAVAHFSKLGVTEAEILAVLKIKSVSDIGAEELITLAGIKTAIKENMTTVEQTFRPKKESVKANEPTHEDVFGKKPSQVIAEIIQQQEIPLDTEDAEQEKSDIHPGHNQEYNDAPEEDEDN